MLVLVDRFYHVPVSTVRFPALLIASLGYHIFELSGSVSVLFGVHHLHQYFSPTPGASGHFRRGIWQLLQPGCWGVAGTLVTGDHHLRC